MLTFNPEISVGHIISVLSAIVGVVITVGRVSQKLDELRSELRDLATEVHEHIKDDGRRFEDLAKTLHRLSGKLGNGG